MRTRKSQHRRGLLVLASKKRAALVPPKKRQSVVPSLDDMILMSLGAGAMGLGVLSDCTGHAREDIEISPGVIVKIARTARTAWFGDRLREIADFAQSIAQANSLDVDLVRRRLLRGDGWTFTCGKLKTPLWMEPHKEVDIAQVAAMLDLRWVASLDSSTRWHERGDYDQKASAAY